LTFALDRAAFIHSFLRVVCSLAADEGTAYYSYRCSTGVWAGGSGWAGTVAGRLLQVLTNAVLVVISRRV
jgi:hypothetical protein